MSFDALNISASALYAQRVKMDTVASNIANVNTTRNPDGTPGTYRRKEVIFEAVYNDAINKGSNGSASFLPSELQANTLQGGISFNTPNTASGVTVSQIVEDKDSSFRKMYNPGHPDADKNGYVNMPNINIVTEMVDMISASRAYEANVTNIEATKNMIAAALRI
ncbi:MAG: flagellar basal body rod protein FlgC [Candidatus Gastranaerophilales bacterium]|nr:flagellar basal body rod protein FlgC [Candidatus Gastranaerophilales bacterium]